MSFQNNESQRPNEKTYILTIQRKKQWFLINPKIKITVDNNTEYKISNGEKINVHLPAGMHNVNFSCGIRNNVVNINLQADTIVNIKWNRSTGSLVVE